MPLAKAVFAFLIGASAASATEMDSTVILPLGAWDMSSNQAHELDLSGLGVAYSDIYDIQIAIRTDFQDGDDEIYNSSSTDRLDRFPAGYSETGKGGGFYLQPVNGKLTLRMYRDLGDPTGGNHGGNGSRLFVNDPVHSYTRTIYVDSKGQTKTMNRGFATITFNGFKGGKSGNTLNQKYWATSTAIPAGNIDLMNFPSNANISYGAWAGESYLGRMAGLNMAIYSNPSNSTIQVRSINQKLSSSSNGYEGPSLFALRFGSDGLSLERSMLTSPSIFGSSAFSGTGNPRGYTYVNHFQTSCDDYGYGLAYSQTTWGTGGPLDCTGGKQNFWVMQTKGNDLWGGADNGQFMYMSTSGSLKTVSARVVHIENVNGFAKFGVCMRASASSDSRYVGVYCSRTNGPMLHWRTTTGGATSRTMGVPMQLPVWVRLQKSGNTFWGEYSTNGTTWTTIRQDNNASVTQTVTLALPTTYVQGMAGSSNAGGIPATHAAYDWRSY